MSLTHPHHQASAKCTYLSQLFHRVICNLKFVSASRESRSDGHMRKRIKRFAWGPEGSDFKVGFVVEYGRIYVRYVPRFFKLPFITPSHKRPQGLADLWLL